MTKTLYPRPYTMSIAATAAITWASLTAWFPEVPHIADVPFYDKWAHFVMYAVLTLAVQCDRYVANKKSTTRDAGWWIWCAVFPTVWGVLMEIAQATLTTYRSGDPVDALANTVGVIIGLIVFWLACACFPAKGGQAESCHPDTAKGQRYETQVSVSLAFVCACASCSDGLADAALTDAADTRA